ncbi:hypothetical protein C6P45_001489 [Maudiozyma exigua]|uniref:Uncharacterized protein n=1 Tax=Maudiozyma exigua TaxID=34358 RepID=A0A9P7BBR3_MAUEX|nr:hypothetical protein C6P45_001489 [Kazachstania exigua]
MLFSKSITLLSICASALAAFNNDTAAYNAPVDKTTTTLSPVTSVEAKTTTWTLSDETTTSYYTFTFYQTHTLPASNQITTTVAAENKNSVVTTVSSAASSEETTFITSTLYSTITQGYSNATISSAQATSIAITTDSATISNASADSNVKTVYVTLEPVTSYVTITADPVTQFVTVTADPVKATLSSSQGQWTNNTITN